MWITVHKFKISVHLFQAVLTFVAACLSLAILTEENGKHDSRVTWYFALCFLTMPVLIYQCIVPCWTRLWRLANPLVYVGIDVVFGIFWISASGAISTYQSASNRKLPKVAMAFGIILCVLFVAATSISGHDAFKFWKTGAKVDRPDIYGRATSFHQNKDDWTTSTQELDAEIAKSDHDWSDERQNSHAASTETREGHHPGRQVSCSSIKTIPYEKELTPSAMSPTSPENRFTRSFPPAAYSFSSS